MKVHNFNEKILQYMQTNPDLTNNDLGVLLLIDNLYLDLPSGIDEFKRKYPHFDPSIIDNPRDGITFLDIIVENYSQLEMKNKLNDYLNIKFNSVGSHNLYDVNGEIFGEYSRIVSKIIDNLLMKAKFPVEIRTLLRESDDLLECHDICDLANLYKNTEKTRLKFAILRRIGLVVLIARIKRSFSFEDLDFAVSQIELAFKNNLFSESLNSKNYYYWSDHNYKSHYFDNINKAKIRYSEDCKMRSKLASKIYDMQVFETFPFLTKNNNKILHFEIRNKLMNFEGACFTSIVEKMIRKNLEFPNQIHDIIGLKIIVPTPNDIPRLIDELETFLGGSSTRKREKNALNKFGKKQLSEYSSGEYFVWKAIYDIALPHPSINKVKEIIEFVDEDSVAYKMLKKRIEFFVNNPRDFVVEVQIQDLNSYILGNAKGSIPHHSMLKMVQIKENSFYKLFPIEIYKDELWDLKEKILSVNS